MQSDQNIPLRKQRGHEGEILANKYLQKNGYRILDINWQTRWAEIDLVAIDGDTLVFVEVKTRHSREYGAPEEAITPHKLKSLEHSALLFKQQHPELPEALRIDFVGIDYAEGDKPRINLIKNISL